MSNPIISNKCKICNGKGWIFVGNGEDYQCDKCLDQSPDENKYTISNRSINIDEWRKQTNQPPLNPPSSTIVGTMDLPKHDPVKLQSYIEKFQLPF